MRRKLTVGAMAAMSMFIGMAQASVTDDFESGSFSTDWAVANIATIMTETNGNKYAHVTGAAANGDVLGGYFGADATDLTAGFSLSFDFRFTDTGQRQMALLIGSRPGYSAATQNATGAFINFVYDGIDNSFKAHSGSAYIALTNLPTNLADDTWHSVTITGSDFGTSAAAYDITVNGDTQTGISIFQNPTYATTVKADGFNFNDRYGDNPGFDVDNVSAAREETLFEDPSGTPTGYVLTNAATITGTFIDGSSEVDSMMLYLDGALVASNNAYAGGSTTNAISYAATGLQDGTHTGMVTAVDADLNSLSYTWTFQVVLGVMPPPAENVSALYNINFAGTSESRANGLALYPVTNGTVAVAPPVGSNVWFNVDYANPWYYSFQAKSIPEASGDTNMPAIVYELIGSASPGTSMYIPWDWISPGVGPFSVAATNTIWATAMGKANADMQFELRNLDASKLYDLYLYFTCPLTSDPETTTAYSITTGNAPVPVAILTSTQDPLQEGFVFTNNYAFNTNYLVITEIAPVGNKIGLKVEGGASGGGLSAMQLVARQPVVSVVPNIRSMSVSGGMVSLTWDSEPSVSYSIGSRSDLLSGSWNVVTNGIPSGGANTSASVPGTEDVQFYSISGE